MINRKGPLAIDLYCGSFGWSAGWLARGGRVIGFDLEHREWHGSIPDGATIVLQDVRSLCGAQLSSAQLILASPPCHEFSWRAMPWRIAKAAPPPVMGIELFQACFRIQREACEAAGRHIPMVVENVRGAQPWVGRAKGHFGSFYLWGDVPALLPIASRLVHRGTNRPLASTGRKSRGMNWSNRELKGQDFTRIAAKELCRVKSFTPNGGPLGKNQLGRSCSSGSHKRKMMSAIIAEIPYILADWVAEVYWPRCRGDEISLGR